jgi:hypothetical protein
MTAYYAAPPAEAVTVLERSRVGDPALGWTMWASAAAPAPHHVRAMAEALGREVPASKYSPSMNLHPMFRAEVLAKDSMFLSI